MKEARHNRLLVVSLQLYELSRKGDFLIESESRAVLAWDKRYERRTDCKWTVENLGGGGGRNVLKLGYVVPQFREFAKNHRMLCLKWVNFIIC